MIPVNEPLMAKNALKYISECIETGWISSAGSYINKFEEKFAEYLGVKYAITTTSGTTALHLAVGSLGIGQDDEVIIPALTMIAVPYAILYTGALPALVDVDSEIFNINPEKIVDFIDRKCKHNPHTKQLIDKTSDRVVKAIMPVHLYGHPCPMDEIMDIAKKYNLYVIEDAAEAHGALYFSNRLKAKENKTPKENLKTAVKAGTIGDVGCFSFYANKIITTGEGGMVVTNSQKIAEKARRLKDLAHSPKKRFFHTELAFNYRMTNMQAAVGVAQMEEIERFLGIKRKMTDKYKELLGNIEGLTLPVEKSWARSVYWMYSVLVEKNFGISRDDFMQKLRKEDIDTRTFFIPVNKQPLFRDNELYKSNSFPVAQELSEKGLYLPSGLALTEEQIIKVCSAIKKIRENS